MLRCYTFDKQKDRQNVREKVHIKLNLESAHKLYNYCNAIWLTASLRANYMEIAEYYKKRIYTNNTLTHWKPCELFVAS